MKSSWVPFLHHPLWIASTLLRLSDFKHDLSRNKQTADCTDQEDQSIKGSEYLTQQICHAIQSNAEANKISYHHHQDISDGS
jgi:hypothetical protein